MAHKIMRGERAKTNKKTKPMRKKKPMKKPYKSKEYK